jgi:GNAT superfamily N-acetyltransferase
MPLQIIPFNENHLEDAARLVCDRYTALLEQEPVMPVRYTEVSAILPRLQDLLQQGTGVAALRGDKLVGFLHGFALPDFLGKRSLYSPEWANATALQDSRRIYEEMYAQLSADWVADNCFQHAITLFANDRADLEAWQWLSFGMFVVDAIRDISPIQLPPTSLEIRRATIADLSVASAFSAALNNHLCSPPVFVPHDSREMNNWLADPMHSLFLAYADNQALGSLSIEPGYTEGCLVTRDEKTIAITHAYTLEQTRCQGIATTLLSHALDYARSQGYTRCAVDFEAANYQARRFWLTNFRPVCYSLLRILPVTHPQD